MRFAWHLRQNAMSTFVNTKLEEVRIAGKTLYVPSADICGQRVVVTGKWIRTAQVKDEAVVERGTIEEPNFFIIKLKKSKLKSDVFTFAQRPPEVTPKFDYH